MKGFAVLAFFAIVAYASAATLPELVYDGPMVDDTDSGFVNSDDFETRVRSRPYEEVPATKPRRVICNLWHYQLRWISVNDATCGSICVDQGHKGGNCVEGVCQCR